MTRLVGFGAGWRLVYRQLLLATSWWWAGQAAVVGDRGGEAGANRWWDGHLEQPSRSRSGIRATMELVWLTIVYMMDWIAHI